MVYEGSDTSSDSYSGGFEFRCRDKRNLSEIIICDSDRETETKCASEESIDQTKNEDELVSCNNMEIDNRDKEKSEEDESRFQGLSRYQKKLMFQNLKTLGAETRKELTDEWKALNVEELQLSIKKQTFSAKLANASV